MMKPVIKCSDCRQKTMRLVRDRYVAEVKHDGRPYTVELPELQYYRCDHCGAIVIPDEADKEIGRELRRVAGLLMPEDIRAERERLSLSQKELAELIGVAEATISRWETGGQIQQSGYDKQLRAFFALPGMREFLRGLLVHTVHPCAHEELPAIADCGTSCAIPLAVEHAVAHLIWIETCTNMSSGREFWGKFESEADSTYLPGPDTDWMPEPVANRLARYMPVGR